MTESSAQKIEPELFASAALLVNAYLLNKYGVSVKFDSQEGGMEMRVIGASAMTFFGREPGGGRPQQLVVKIGNVP